MTRLATGLLAVLSMAAITTDAFAQRPEGDGKRGERREGDRREGDRRRGQGGSQRGRFTLPLMAAIDADGNGTISKEEIAKASAALKALDKDGDGELSREEYFGSRFGQRSGGQRPGGGGGDFAASFVRRIMENDKNKDGKISKEEMPERGRENFDASDTDKDGFLSEAELKKSIEERFSRFRQGGNRRPGQGRPGEGSGRPRRPSGDGEKKDAPKKKIDF